MKRIPSTVNKLTLETYQRLKQVQVKPMDEADRPAKLLSVVTGLSLTEIDNLPIWKLTELYGQMSVLLKSQPTKRIKKRIWINGKRYSPCLTIEELNTNQYTSFKTFQQNELANYHNLASIIYLNKPVFGKASFDESKVNELSKLFLKQKVGKVFGALFFYSNELTKLSNSSIHSLAHSQEIIKDRIEEMAAAVARGDLQMPTAGTM